LVTNFLIGHLHPFTRLHFDDLQKLILRCVTLGETFTAESDLDYLNKPQHKHVHVDAGPKSRALTTVVTAMQVQALKHATQRSDMPSVYAR
jgi:hypothetical protein